MPVVGRRRGPHRYRRSRLTLADGSRGWLVWPRPRQNRHGLRNALMISLAYHHGLRVSELIALRWNAIDWKRADVAVNRLKGSKQRAEHGALHGWRERSLRGIWD